MAKQVWKGSAQLSPVPCVLVTSGSVQKPNVFTVGWTGIINSQPPKLYVSIRPERYSYELIKESRELVVNLPTQAMTRSVDICGVRSGRDMDKFAKCHFTPVPASEVSAPVIEECPIALECKVFDIIPLGTHDMFLCDIVAVDVEEKLLDEKGKLRMEKCNLIAYSHGDYMALGRKLGSFGYSVRKKKNNKREK
ncbi:MAG: flavin reductase family protein [Clostridia bacterium]|nr:flavin reductase family protein [Clostridia bacterium]